jgi:hypothetical protein
MKLTLLVSTYIGLGLSAFVSFSALGEPQGHSPRPAEITTPPAFDWLKFSAQEEMLSVTLQENNKFGRDGHLDANEHLTSDMTDQCVRELNKAMYWQDTVHQFQSKAHFDNCAIEDSLTYIHELVSEAEQYLLKSTPVNKSDALKAAFSLGQALHAIQDFYAHSNYVELMVKKHDTFDDVQIVPVWLDKGQETLLEMTHKGLHSGSVWWGLPQYCPSTVPSHGALAKDSVKTDSGSIVIDKWEAINQFQLAKALASQASLEFLQDMYTRMPLKPICGNHISFAVLTDNREL